MRRRVILVCLCACSAVGAEETLCRRDETIIFSCHVGEKMVSLCRPEAVTAQMTYRFGTPAHVELVYPDPCNKDKGHFYSSTAPLYGGGETTVSFARGPYEYRIYSKLTRSEADEPQNRIPIFEDGLVIAKNGKQVRKLVCDDGGAGFREDIAWIPSR